MLSKNKKRELEKNITKDLSLYGKLHNIYYHALMMRTALENGSENQMLIDKIRDKSYQALSIIKVHPNQAGSILHKQNLEGYLKEIALFISIIPQEFTDSAEVIQMKLNLLQASQMAMGETPLLS